LERARQSLLHAEADDTVTAIAERCGFSSLSVFSRDFRAAFGVSPSELLREGREFSG
jgi:AraC-like DNA-binding protein